MSGAAIRAGEAFVEMLIRDETVQASLDNVNRKLQTFGQSVDAIGQESFVAMNATATASLFTTGSAIAVCRAGLGVLDAAVFATANAFRVAFNIATTSVTRAVLALSVAAFTVARFARKDGPLAGVLNGFLTNSAITEGVGRWTRFIGLLTGSTALKGLGNQIERAGMGAAILQGFRSGGLIGGLSSTLGVVVRSTRSILTTGLVGLFSAPLAALRGGLSAVTGGRVAPALAAMSGSSAPLGGNLQRAAAGARSFGTAANVFGSVAAGLRSVLLRVTAVSAAFSGPAILSAKRFVAAAEEITAASKKTGDEFVSVEQGIRNRFGRDSLITPADIAAGVALGKTMTELKQAAAAAWAQIGVSALPVLKTLTENSLWAAQALTNVLGQNRNLITSGVSLAARLGTITAAALSLYAVWPMLASGIGLVLSPIGLMTAGIVGLAFAFPRLRTEAADVLQFLFGGFFDLGDVVSETMAGIADALSGGSILTAARVLWAGLNVAWLAGTENLRSVWRELVNGLSQAWINLGATLERVMVNVVDSIRRTWRGAQNILAGGIARLIATATGQDVNEVLATLTEMQDAERRGTDDTLKRRLDAIEAERVANLESLSEIQAAKAAAADKELADARAELAAARAEAARIRKPRSLDPAADLLNQSSATSLGTFGTSALGRQSIGGLGDLKKSSEETARNTAETVAAVRDIQMNWA